MAATKKFTINVLGADQGELCWRFAKESDDRFAGIDWHPSSNGCPSLSGSLVTIDCDLESNQVHGDHHFAVGRVTHLDVLREADAMAFYRGKVVSVTAAE